MSPAVPFGTIVSVGGLEAIASGAINIRLDRDVDRLVGVLRPPAAAGVRFSSALFAAIKMET
jgi:hypothetical protein